MNIKNELRFFLSTEVKAKNIAPSEYVANVFLTPAQYLLNGKKVDLIKDGDQLAAQTDFIYPQNKPSSYLKTTVMIVLFIPSVLLGSLFKAYATALYHNKKDDTFIKKIIIKKVGLDKIYVPRGQTNCSVKINTLKIALRKANSDLPTKTTLFLSEVQVIRLAYESNHPPLNGKNWLCSHNQRGIDCNNKILQNIQLLWNLSYINLADRYIDRFPGAERQILGSINPNVTALESPSMEFTKTMPAKEFFALKFPPPEVVD